MEKIIQNLKKWNKLFCSGMVCRTNLKRDIIIILTAIIISAAIIVFGRYHYQKKIDKQEARQAAAMMTEDQLSEDVQRIQNTVDTSGWKKYQNDFYGFSVKYPQEWDAPKIQKAIKNSKWEVRYQFRRNQGEDNVFSGFDVVIYSVAKTKELPNTDEFPSIKSDDLKDQPQCANIEGHVIDTGDYPAAEIYIPPTDDCFNPVLFFSFIRDQYIYNIVPIAKDGSEIGSDPRIVIDNNFPEFLSVISTAELTDIKRPAPVPAAPKITAPMPLSYIVVGGRLVCAKKNDHPQKSAQHKGKHMDMECCLDPDEYPNPHCYYPPEKYGKYL